MKKKLAIHYSDIDIKINSLNLILETIDNELKGIDVDESTSEKVKYLNSRKSINLKKLLKCHESKMTLRKSEQ